MSVIAGQFDSNVVKDEFSPTQVVENTIEGGEIFSQAAFICHGGYLLTLLLVDHYSRLILEVERV